MQSLDESITSHEKRQTNSLDFKNRKLPDSIPSCGFKRAMLNDCHRCHRTKFGDYNPKWPSSWPTLQS
uniref:Uncharacterized protein n=1 Tax=Romanomermis culicivorax TaxID=13658 RepID=A0A915K0I9_ROMCU